MRISEEAARAEGLEPQQHQLLLAVKAAPADQITSIAYLADRLQLKHHSVSELVERLVEGRLVDRRRDEADGRRAIISLTRTGDAMLHHLSLLHQDELRSRAAELVSAMAAIVRATAKRR